MIASGSVAVEQRCMFNKMVLGRIELRRAQLDCEEKLVVYYLSSSSSVLAASLL